MLSCCTIGQSVVGWVTVFWQAYCHSMQPATHVNSAFYPLWSLANTCRSECFRDEYTQRKGALPVFVLILMLHMFKLHHIRIHYTM